MSVQKPTVFQNLAITAKIGMTEDAVSEQRLGGYGE